MRRRRCCNEARAATRREPSRVRLVRGYSPRRARSLPANGGFSVRDQSILPSPANRWMPVPSLATNGAIDSPPASRHAGRTVPSRRPSAGKTPCAYPSGRGSLRRCVVLAARPRGYVPPNTLSEAEQRSGWRLLFDGTTADGFRNYRKDSLNDGWQVTDSAPRSPAGAGDIVTRDQFDAFELQLEYRIAPGGNSGIMFHVTEDAPAPWMSGPEVQILDNAGGNESQKAGFLYQLYQPQVPKWVRQV